MMNSFAVRFKEAFFKALSAEKLSSDLVNITFFTLNIKLLGWIGFLAACNLPSASWLQAFGIAFVLTIL